MKCVVDLDLLFPPPVPGTLHFEEMVLHDDILGHFDLKVAISFELMSVLWDQWSQVRYLQYKKFLLQILTRHLAQDFPESISV